MAAPSTTNEVTVRRLSSIITGIWDKIKDTFQTKLTTQTAYSAKGTATKVPQITTNSLGQVTGITEVDINAGGFPMLTSDHASGSSKYWKLGTTRRSADGWGNETFLIYGDSNIGCVPYMWLICIKHRGTTPTLRAQRVGCGTGDNTSKTDLELGSYISNASDNTYTVFIKRPSYYADNVKVVELAHDDRFTLDVGYLSDSEPSGAVYDDVEYHYVPSILDGRSKGSTTVPVYIDGNSRFQACNTSSMTVGNATNATTASAVSTEGAGTSDAARHVWFSDSATETKRVYNDNFKYNPSGNIVTANISGNAATASDAAAVGPYSAFASSAAAFGFSRLGTVIFSSSAKKGLMTFRVHASRSIAEVYVLHGEFGRNDQGGMTARFMTEGPDGPLYKLCYKDVSDSTNPKYEIWLVDTGATGSLERRVRIELISVDISGFDRNFTSQQTNPGSLTDFWKSTINAYMNWKCIDTEMMSWNGTSNRVYQSIGYSPDRGSNGTTTTLLISNGDSGGVQGTYLVRFLHRGTPIVQYKQLFGVTSDRDIMEFGYYISGDYAYLTVYKPKWASQRPIHVISLDDGFVFARGSATTSAPSGYVAGTEQGFSSLADKGDGDGNNRVFAHWTGNNVTSVTPSSSQARTGTKWLVAGYTESDGTHFNVVDVNNVTVKNAQQINGYPVIVGQLGTATGTIYFV